MTRPTLMTTLTAVTFMRNASRCCIERTTVDTLLRVRRKLTGANHANVTHNTSSASKTRSPTAIAATTTAVVTDSHVAVESGGPEATAPLEWRSFSWNV